MDAPTTLEQHKARISAAETAYGKLCALVELAFANKTMTPRDCDVALGHLKDIFRMERAAYEVARSGLSPG